ncbi:MAG: hypothetical protein KBT40_01655 [bacterium]|nr:hypothetical protein [Candidatus Minthenecus merdequi]
MAKKKNNQSQKSLTPEEYIRKRARNLPIYKCYKVVNDFDDREMAVFVIRQHSQGTFTYAAYMLDLWCLGVKDSMWDFNVSENLLMECLSQFEENAGSLEEIKYVEAHNWVYGAFAFAADAGIKPCKDFQLTRYLLEEDNEDVELIEYDFGRDGEYCLVTMERQEAARYIPILDRNLGRGNYTVEIGIDRSGWDDDDWDDDYKYSSYLDVPRMEYTYKGKAYPKEVELLYPDVESVVLKDTQDITDEDIEAVLSHPADLLRKELHNLVLRELGRQWGKTRDELDDNEDNSWNIVGNAFMFLTKVATVEDTLPVVLEVMRQDMAFKDFNISDSAGILLYPILCVLVKDNPRLLKSYLLEPGLNTSFKNAAFELLEYVAEHCPQSRQENVDMIVEVLNEYKKDLPYRKICDGTVTAFAISVLVGAGAVEHLPLIEELYATGLIDETLEGHIEVLRNTIKNPEIVFDLPPMDPYDIRDKSKKLWY